MIRPAAALAAALGSGLQLVQVISTLSPVTYFSEERWEDERRTRDIEARTYLETLAVQLRNEGLHVEIQTRFGQPASTLAHLADENQAVGLAIATHGRTGVARALMGSVASSVLQRANVPLLILRPASMLEHEATLGAVSQGETVGAPSTR